MRTLVESTPKTISVKETTTKSIISVSNIVTSVRLCIPDLFSGSHLFAVCLLLIWKEKNRPIFKMITVKIEKALFIISISIVIATITIVIMQSR